jgi:hypothetical protein
MMRCVWQVIVAAGLGAVALPGCAPCARNLLHCNAWQDPPPGATPGQQPHPGPYAGLEESEAGPSMPRRPNEVYTPYLTGHLVATTPRLLPMGQRVAEATGPPQVLPPRDPGQVVLPDPQTVTPPGSLDPQVLTPVSNPEVGHDEPVVQALFCLFQKKPDQALDFLKSFDRTNQDLFMRLLSALAILHDKSFDQLTPGEVATLDQQMQGVLAVLRHRSDLVIDKLCLCERIDGYGQYKAVRPGHAFLASTARQAGEWVQVYVELRNLTCELRGTAYVTALAGSVNIRDARGDTVWSYNYRKREQPLCSPNPRFDNFRAYGFYVPTMPPGQYTLTVEIVDETQQPFRMAHKSVEFVVAPPIGP